MTTSTIADLLQKKSKKHDEKVEVLAQEHKLAEEQTEEDIAAVYKAITDVIDTNDIVVYSKSYCPYCRQAKMMLKSIPNLDFLVIELDDGNHIGWQGQIAEIAKDENRQQATVVIPNNNCVNNDTKSVPQIFIHHKYIGGADDLADMYTDGRLAQLLNRDTLS